MKELIDYIWNMPMIVLLIILAIPFGLFCLWFLYLVIGMKRSSDAMDKDFNERRRRIRSKTRKL